MDENTFWSLVERAAKKGRGDQERMTETLQSLLADLEPEEIQKFKQIYGTLAERAFTWDLWGAAFIMNGGCSDDGFDYFRAWLIAQGRATWEAALANPESLADAKLRYALEDGYDFESLMYASDQAYEEVTGAEIPILAATSGVIAPEPRGAPWAEHELAKRFPRLWKKFGAALGG